MGTWYGCKRCNYCGFNPGRGLFAIGYSVGSHAFCEFVFCKDCNELMTTDIGYLDLIRIYYNNSEERYLIAVQDDPDYHRGEEYLPKETHCHKCKGTNVESLAIHSPPKGHYKTIKISSRSRDLRPKAKNFRSKMPWPIPTNEMIDCPVCHKGKISLTKKGQWLG